MQPVLWAAANEPGKISAVTIPKGMARPASYELASDFVSDYIVVPRDLGERLAAIARESPPFGGSRCVRYRKFYQASRSLGDPPHYVLGLGAAVNRPVT